MTTYSQQLQYIGTPTFDKVRNLAINSLRMLSRETIDRLHNRINHGVDILTEEQQMWVYLYSFGKMHQEKLKVAFENIPTDFFEQSNIRIIDYGCGQAIGTMCYADFLKRNNYEQNIERITLIEPSEICLKRASLHASIFFPNAKIHIVNKTFDQLRCGDIIYEKSIPTLHILSNVLDLECFDLKNFVTLIKKSLKGYNQFVCVGPYFHNQNRDNRMKAFSSVLGDKENYSKIFDKYQLNVDKTWTAQIRCFSNGNLLLSVKATDIAIQNGITDKFGVVYSQDGRRLLNCNNKRIEKYSIKEGTLVICNNAFKNCSSLQQITIPNSVIWLGSCALMGCSSLQQITLPESIRRIDFGTFAWCSSLQQINMPQTLSVISSGIFAYCSSLCKIDINGNHQMLAVKENMLIDIKNNKVLSVIGECDSIVIPNTITCIGGFAFVNSTSIRQISIPNSVNNIEKYAFENCSSLQRITLTDNDVQTVKEVLNENLWDIIEEKYTVNVTPNDINNGIEDEFGVLYSKDGKRLLKCRNSKLKEYTIKDNTIVVGISAFSNCKLLRQIIIPGSVKSIGDSSFNGCASVQQIIVPDSVEFIGSSAFSKCSSLLKISIPNSVTEIGAGALNGCTSLQNVLYN